MATGGLVIALDVDGSGYTANVRRDGDQWLWCEVEKLPGYFASGRTIAELTEATTEAVRLVLGPTASPA